MSKKLFLLLAICSIPLFAIAQQSIGFSDPDNIQPLLDYRLPEWGYTNFYLDFSLDGNLDRTYLEQAEHISTNNEFSIQLAPVYYRFYESESRQSNYSFRSTIDYFLDKSNGYQDEKESATNYNLEFTLNLDEKFYLDNSDIFLRGGLLGSYDQAKTDLQANQNNSFYGQWDFARSFETALSFGVGFGRIRNVNPVIRSLRLGERLNALDVGQSMNDQDYISAAEHFTKFNGYQNRYDRPEKYFWGDMNEIISPNLAALNPFDLLYLTDTTLETIGSRQEGWEIQALITLDYSARYTEDETLESGSELSESTVFQPSISGSWSKNLSLKHQLGLSANLQSFILLDDDGSDPTLAIVSGSWLYTITDRILSKTNVTLIQHFTNPRGFLTANSEIDYFIENRFSLFSNIVMVHRPKFLDENHDHRSVQLFFSAGMRYYLKRELF